MIAGAFIIGGFLALSVGGAAARDARALAARSRRRRARGSRGLAVGLSIALWNYIGWDNASTVQGEVQDASRSYPRALAIALPLVGGGLSHSAARDTLGHRLDDVDAKGDGRRSRCAAGGAAGPLLAAWIAVGGHGERARAVQRAAARRTREFRS